MRELYQKLTERGPFWVLKKLLVSLRELLLLPYGWVQIARASRAAKVASGRPRVDNCVVFVCQRVDVRALKLAYGLKAAGWTVVLVHKDPLTFDVSDYFSEVWKFDSPTEALLIATRYAPVVYHVFALWNFAAAALFIRHKPGPIVFDNYDVLNGMVKERVLKRYPGQVELERYCYLHADGICSRDLRVQYLKRSLGYRLPPVIFFPEYCWPANKVSKSRKLNEGIHVVYVGSIEPRPESPVAYLYDLADLLSEKQVHLHIYPSYPAVTDELKRNLETRMGAQRVGRYVHVHGTISPLEIPREVSKYDYGILLSSRNIEFGSDNETYFEHQGDYFLAAKLFDYLDGGLFTFTQNARLARCILGKAGAGKVVRSLQEIQDHCINESPREISVPRSLLLTSNINRLSAFYRTVSSNLIHQPL